jgi:hypothetical protein
MDNFFEDAAISRQVVWTKIPHLDCRMQKKLLCLIALFAVVAAQVRRTMQQIEDSGTGLGMRMGGGHSRGWAAGFGSRWIASVHRG